MKRNKKHTNPVKLKPKSTPPVPAEKLTPGYKGEMNTYGRPNGNGIRVYNNGERYDGQWSNDNRHGNGAYYYQNGDIYQG